MTLAYNVAKVFAVVSILSTAFLLLPPADVLDSTALTVPDVIWNPFTAVLRLNRYFPVTESLVVISLAMGIKVGMAGLWIFSWLLRHVAGGG